METFIYRDVFTCCGSSCGNRMWVTFHLGINNRVWETFHCLWKNWKGLTVFLRAGWFELPDISMGAFFLFLPFLGFSGSFTSGYICITVQGGVFPAVYIIHYEWLKRHSRIILTTCIFHIMLNREPNASKRSNFILLFFSSKDWQFLELLIIMS